MVNLGGVVKTLRRSNSLSRSIFSTVGSFGHAHKLFGVVVWLLGGGSADFIFMGARIFLSLGETKG